MTEQPRRPSRAPFTILMAAVSLGAACGGSSTVVRPPTSSPHATESSVASPTGPASTGTHRPVVTARPATGLHNDQQITVQGSGFSPNLALQVVECADKGKATGAGDCNLAGMLGATSDAGGNLTVQLQVLQGPFGANNIVCGPKQRCLVSVTEASLQPNEEADVPIAFAS